MPLKTILQKAEREFNEQFGNYWSKVPSGNTLGWVNLEDKRPIILSQESVKSFLSTTLADAIKEAFEEVKLKEEETLVEAFDNDGHRYQIPQSKMGEWWKWCQIPDDDFSSWEVPEYAERIDGMPVKTKTYTDCLSELSSNQKAFLAE